MILSILNNKGGCSKTTTAVNLSAGLADRKRRVLLVDLDGQASASLSVGISRTALKPSIADVLLHGTPAQRVIRKTGVDHLDIISGSMDLANADFVLSDMKGREHRLRAALADVTDEYDDIVFDTPPSIGILSVNALTACDQIIIPTTPQYLALEGLIGMMEAIDRIRSGAGSSAAVMGILLTSVDRRARSTSEIIDIIRGHYKDLVFMTEIKVNIRLAEAPSFGQTIFQYDSTSTGAACYHQLVDEVLRRIKHQSKV